MRKQYFAPQLYVDYYAPDTMIASGSPKNGNADNNQNCWGCNRYPGEVTGENACVIIKDTPAYDIFC